MKHLIILFTLFLFSGPVSAQSVNLQQFAWLEGTWKKTNTKPGRSGYEKWERTSSVSWQGIGVTMNGADTVFIEKLNLLIRNNDIYYVADVAENKEPTYFKITAIKPDGFTCEDPSHDFPKKIVYARDGNKLKVTASGDDRSIDFYFEK
jgi:hypothetical protein